MAKHEEAPLRRVQARRIVEIDLGEMDAAYEGQKITAWVNFPRTYLTAVRPEDADLSDEERLYKTLGTIIQSHDLVDFEGDLYPPAHTAAFWEAIPNDLSGAIIQAIGEQAGKLSKPSAGRPSPTTSGSNR